MPLAELTTERLWLRTWREPDRAPFAALNADPEVMQFFVAPFTREQSDTLIERIEAHIREHGFGLWAVELRAEQRFVGFVGLAVTTFPAPFTPCVEIGWRLARDAWGRGYASEAARAALRFGFETLAPEEIVAYTVPDNIRSRRVMERIGMQRDEHGDFDHPRVPDGHPLRRHVLYRLSRKRWQSDLDSAAVPSNLRPTLRD
jgi:RimJ/RimL family protein N-acetyltransferase